MSYLRYLCLLANSGVQHTLCCVFVLFVFVLSLVHPMLLVSSGLSIGNLYRLFKYSTVTCI